ncbi:hypothetical protein GALL_206080 [mine drainage metagenome]|uniref:Uncharacterized protein n=1 Tax=mine drainage metagenome TaxID=410659 RepID=A0A1J5SAV2_9ZZZZ
MRTKKTYDYIIVIKTPAAYKLIDFFSQLLLLMSVAAFILAGIKNLQGNFMSNIKNISTLYFLAAAIIFYWLIYCNNQKRKGKEVYYRFGLLIAAFGWYLNKSEWLFFSIAYLVIGVLEKPLKVLPEAAFDKEEIVFNSFPQKKYLWKDVANAILKDNILTIDLKNNKLIQKEIDAEISEADEKDFNEFCREQLNR